MRSHAARTCSWLRTHLISSILVPFLTTRQCRIGRSSMPTIRGSVGCEAEAGTGAPCPLTLDVSLGPAAAESNGYKAADAAELGDSTESSASTVSSTGPWMVFWRGMTRNGAGEV
jgi:hypothetical protein